MMLNSILLVFVVRFFILGKKSSGGRRFVLPRWWQDFRGLVVACQTMDTALHENQTEFGIFVFTIAFQMFANSDGFLDQVMQIFGFAWSKAFRFHDAKNFAASDETSLGDTVRITKNNT